MTCIPARMRKHRGELAGIGQLFPFSQLFLHPFFVGDLVEGAEGAALPLVGGTQPPDPDLIVNRPAVGILQADRVVQNLGADDDPIYNLPQGLPAAEVSGLIEHLDRL